MMKAYREVKCSDRLPDTYGEYYTDIGQLILIATKNNNWTWSKATRLGHSGSYNPEFWLEAYATQPDAGELTVDVWDWVVTKGGKVVQITADDMPELPYEDIKRKATVEDMAELVSSRSQILDALQGTSTPQPDTAEERVRQWLEENDML